MSNTSQRPWRVNGHSIEANDPEGLWLQNEKTGWGVVANLPSCPKSRMSKENRETWDAIVEANATLIVNAVNEHDHLRDLVRRLTHVAQNTLDFAEVMCGIIPDNPERAKARSEIEGLLSEAREAIGEETK